jgi:phosphoglycerate-specific signal transduction histidine kinase
MDQQQQSDAPSRASRIEQAKDLNAKVAQDLEVAGAELHLNNTVLDRHLPEASHPDELQRALNQNVALEEKVQDAAADLAEATGLLQEEVAERKRLERELAAGNGAPAA